MERNFAKLLQGISSMFQTYSLCYWHRIAQSPPRTRTSPSRLSPGQLPQSSFDQVSSLQRAPDLMWCLVNNVPIFQVSGEVSEIPLLFRSQSQQRVSSTSQEDTTNLGFPLAISADPFPGADNHHRCVFILYCSTGLDLALRQ